MRSSPSSKSKIRVIVADDSEAGRANMKAVLSEDGYEVQTASGGDEAYTLFEKEGADLIVTDLFMGQVGGQALLERVKARAQDVPVIVVTGYPSVATAIEALKKGAADYLIRPFAKDELRLVAERCIAGRLLKEENARLKRALGLRAPVAPEIVGESPEIKALLVSIQKAACEAYPVLVVGESGTGKDLVARALHLAGPRTAGPFLAINCGAVPESLFESELFGHVKGAFTSADRDRMGMFEAASGGTLFLDEIESTSLRVQAKLLRVVEGKTVVPVGSVHPRPVDTRLVFSSQGGLKEKIQEGNFRQDLYYRINVVQLQIPPLRQRPTDIPVLVEHFLSRMALEDGKPRKIVSPGAMTLLSEYNWPGNVRELEHALERACLFAEGAIVAASDLPSEIAEASLQSREEGPKASRTGKRSSLKDALKDFEKEYISRVVSEMGGNKALAAEMLDVDLSTLYRKMKP